MIRLEKFFKNFVILLALAIGLQAKAEIPTFEFKIESADLSTFNKMDVFSKDEFNAKLSVGGKTYDEFKIGRKGNTSLLYPKRAFKTRFVTDSNLPPIYHSNTELNLNPLYTDKSYLREKLVWHMFDMMKGLGPKEHGHVNVILNGVSSGVYLLMQRISKNFLKTVNKPQATVFEAKDVETSANMKPLSRADLSNTYALVTGDEANYSDLQKLIEQLGSASDAEFADVLHENFDTKTIYDWFALNAITMQGDSYVKNYFLLFEPNKTHQKWSIIPWDYDISMGRDGNPLEPYPSAILNDLYSYSYPILAGPENVLKTRIMNDPRLVKEFKQHLAGVLEKVFNEEVLFPKIDSWVRDLSPLVKVEPIRWGTFSEFYQQIDALKHFISARRNFLKKTFLSPDEGGLNNEVKLKITTLNKMYDFVDASGKTIAKMNFSEFQNLKSITVRAFPSSTPEGFSEKDNQFVKRYIEVIPEPHDAKFKARLQWEYLDGAGLTEVWPGLMSDGGLESFNYQNRSWKFERSEINTFGNFVDLRVNQNTTGAGKFFALQRRPEAKPIFERQKNLFWNRWLDSKQTEANEVLVVGDDGILLRSTDSGKSWSEKYLGVHTQIRALALPSEKLYFAVGMYGNLLRSKDAGKTWTSLKNPSNQNLNATFFIDEKSGYVVGDKGVVLSTKDAGHSWRQVKLGEEAHLSSVVVTQNKTAVISDDKGAIYVSSVDDLSWKKLFTAKRKINKLFLRNENEIWGVGNEGIVVISKDKGQTWSSQQLETKADLFAFVSDGSGKIYVAGENGEIFSSQNSKTWVREHNYEQFDIQSLQYIKASGKIMAVGNWGSLLFMK